MTARIIYDGNTIDFLIAESGPIPASDHNSNVNRSSSGKVETISTYGIQKLTIPALFSQTVFNQLWTWWWSWARFGNEFAFAIDNTKTVNTTLDGAAAADQAVIPLTATTGLTAGDHCAIVAADNQSREAIEILSISAGVSVTATANLVNAFASGDAFHHLEYYPILVKGFNAFTPQRTGIINPDDDCFYKFNFVFEESL